MPKSRSRKPQYLTNEDDLDAHICLQNPGSKSYGEAL